MIETDIKLQVVQLRAKGKSIAKIAEALSISKQTVVDIIQENKEEVSTLYAMELEELYETEKVNVEERIKSLSKYLKKIGGELESRSLADVPTEKLLDLYLKVSTTIDATKITPTFQSSKEQREAIEEREALERIG